jgi:hypothetical protein
MNTRGTPQLDPSKPLEYRPDEGAWTAGIVVEGQRAYVLLIEHSRTGARGESVIERRAEFYDYQADGSVSPEPIFRNFFTYLIPDRGEALVQASIDFALALDDAGGRRFGTMATPDLQRRLHRLNRTMVVDGDVRPMPVRTAQVLEAEELQEELKRRGQTGPRGLD